ncbi:MAG: 4Fe-4S binding protein [Gammaproteobacteria bacterium]
MKTVFINPERCIGCRQCEFACALAHSRSHEAATAVSEDPRPHTRIHVLPGPAFNTSFPSRCRHCDPAPCIGACPTGAMARDEAEDLVLVDPERCITCAMCAMVCPFDAVDFHVAGNGAPPRLVATKCDGCIERVREGIQPACVEACKVGALVYGELNELIAAGRATQASAVFSAAAATEDLPTSAAVAGWRDWGREAVQVNREVSHGRS